MSPNATILYSARAARKKPMPLRLPDKTVAALADPGSVKLISTVGPDGLPRTALKDSLRLLADGLLEYDELLETSETNKNMTRALWFDRPVAATVIDPGKNVTRISAVPVRCVISGAEYLKRYRELRARDPESDLAAVWRLRPVEAEAVDLASRRRAQERDHPLLTHLDRLLAAND